VRFIPLLVVCLMLPGCVASMAASAVTGVAGGAVRAPFKVGGKVIDMTTTSQAEADRNLGRKARKQREQDRRDQRERKRAES